MAGKSNKTAKTVNYNNMRDSIFGKEGEYQYFKGRAFQQYDDRAVNAMRAGIRQEIWAVAGTTKQNADGKAQAMGDLEHILQQRIDEYFIQEEQLYYKLVRVVERGRYEAGTNPGDLPEGYKEFYSKGTDIGAQIKKWDTLLSMPLRVLFASPSSNIDFSSDQRSALYCFLQSRELYDAIKNIKEISSVFSRKSWLKGQDKGRLSEYDNNIKQVENEMINTLMSNDSEAFIRGMQEGLVEAAGEGFRKVIEGAFGGYVKKHPVPRVDTYAKMHDALKAWGEDLVATFNEHKFSKSKTLADITVSKVNVRNNGVIFFTITAATGKDNLRTEARKTAVGKNEAERAKQAFYDAISNFIDSKKTGPFELTLIGYGKAHFTSNTATAAAKMFKNHNTVFRKAFDKMMSTYEKDGQIKSLDSNSVITGILGEFANYINPTLGDITKTMTGAKQQLYNGKSSGQYFSDLVIDNVQVKYNGKVFTAGLNIKNYMDDNDHFTLAKGQKEGLALNDVKLRRYLTEKEIKLLAFIQANQKLVMETVNKFGNVNMNIEDAATALMDKNIVNLFRIASAEQDVINYLVSANGHFIPASCIFRVALKKLQNNKDYRFYDVLDARPWDYKKQYGRSSKDWVDASQLVIDDLMKSKRPVKYKINEFTVSVSELV